MTEMQRSVWLLSSPACAEYNMAMQNFTGILYEGSEQHKETAKARLAKDHKDAVLVLQYLIERNPFSEVGLDLRSIHTGEIALKTVNVDNAKLIGEAILSKMEGKELSKFTFKKKDKAQTMDFSKSKVVIDEDNISVDPQLLFQRLIAPIQFGNLGYDQRTIFSYELSTFPLSIFGSNGLMRDPKPKTEILIELNKHFLTNQVKLPDDGKYVLDGGSLLHKMNWSKGVTYDDICDGYVRYVLKHFGEGTIIVFDGYDDTPSTKDTTHIRRSKGKIGKAVVVSGNMLI